MSYRDDLEALATRTAALERELAAATRKRDAASKLHDDALARSWLPVLHDVRVATCTSRTEPTYNDCVRTCTACSQRIYTVANRTSEETEALIVRHEGKLPRRYWRRSSSTVMVVDCPNAAKHRRWRFAVASVIVLVASLVIIALRLSGDDDRAPDDRPAVVVPPAVPRALLTCEQVEPEVKAAERASHRAYTQALAAKGLAPITLEPVRIGRATTPEDIGPKRRPGELFSFARGKQQRSAIADEIIETSESARDSDPFPGQLELVADASGDIWRVVRVPKSTSVTSHEVDACQWGCWGQPPSGVERPPPHYARGAWLVPVGRTYRGDVQITYDEPRVILTSTKLCPGAA